jgi:hypothetical protein
VTPNPRPNPFRFRFFSHGYILHTATRPARHSQHGPVNPFPNPPEPSRRRLAAAETLAPSPPSARAPRRSQPARCRSRGLPATMEDWGERLPPPSPPPLPRLPICAGTAPRFVPDHAPPSACRGVTLVRRISSAG